MKRAKVSISKTTNQDMEYKIYRFKNEKPMTLPSEYINIDPVTSLSEKESPVTSVILNDCVPLIVDNGEEYEYKFYSLPFEFVYKTEFFVFNIGTNMGADPNLMVYVYTGNVSLGEVVIKEYDNGTYKEILRTSNREEMAKIVVIENNSTVTLAKNISKDYPVITLTVHANRLTFVDSESNGIYKHQYSSVEKIKDYEIHPKKNTQENIYYYSVIGVHPDGRLSDVSNISAVLLSENPTDINTIVEASDDYHEDSYSASWSEIDKVKASNVYIIKKDDMYSRNIPPLNTNEISSDDSNLQVYGERIVKLPNLWHRDKVSTGYRGNRAYRFINELNGEKSEVSDVFYINGYSKVNIDKIVIYKKNVTKLSESDKYNPIEINDQDSQLLKVYVRSGGIYHADAIIKSEYEPIEIISNNSRFPLLQVNDNCLSSNYYNYTVYLYDENDKQSPPYTVVM